MVSVRTGGFCRLTRPEEALGQPVDQFSIGWRQVVKEAVDRFDDDAPLRETGDGAEGVEARLHFHRHANAELRIVFDLFAFACPGGRSTSATSWTYSMVWHSARRRRGTAEIRQFRCVSDACQQQ